MTTEVKWIADDEVISKLREYSKKKTGSRKRLSETLNDILEEYLNMSDKQNPPIHSDSTHTHNTNNRIGDIITWIETNNPKGITREQIDNVIKDLKGFDIRTINKYEPIVLSILKEKGYYEHPRNPKVLIRYDL